MVGMTLEIELGITGGEEDGVDNSDVDVSKLYTQPEEVAYAYEELMKVSDQFTIAAAFGNVHGVYKPGNVKLTPKILKNSQEFVQEKFGTEYLRAKIVNEDANTFITLHGRKGAGVISSLTGADGIVEIPMEYKSVVKGELLNFYPFDHRGL